MTEIISLVKNNLISRRNIIFDRGKKKMGILDAVLLFIVFIALSEVYVVKIFDELHPYNKEILIFNVIINIQFIITVLFMLMHIMNTFYLASDWKEMMIYPIREGNLLLSKCILCYFSSAMISICMLIFLFSYGLLGGKGIVYYLHVILYQIVITAVPTVYIVLISLTIFWIISAFKKSEKRYKSGIMLIAVDIAVIMITYVLIKSALDNHAEIGTLLFYIFFAESQSTGIFVKFVAALSMIIISCLGFYFFGGNVYLAIMKSGLFSSKDIKETILHVDEYEFKLRSPVVSNIIRDVKQIVRTPALRANCIVLNIPYSIIAAIVLILLRKHVINFANIFNGFPGIKSAIVIIYFLTISVTSNLTSVTSFSREGRGLNELKSFPISSKDLLLSKICVGILSDICTFISTNVLIVLFSSDFTEFIMIEAAAAAYAVIIVIIEIGEDMGNMQLKWVDIKDLFEIEILLKILTPYFIITIVTVASSVLVGFKIIDIKSMQYLNAGYLIFIGAVYSIYSIKKIIRNI